MYKLKIKNAVKRFLFAVSAFFLFQSAKAQGDLQIFPKRVVFDGTKRAQDLSLANSGKDTARYIISIVQIRMKEDGSFETITQPDPGQNFADKNIRFFPRTVVLGPNEAQTVKVQLLKYNELSSGEYRSHIYLRAEPEKKPLGEEKASKDSTSISVKIVPVFGISIPVIIRVGEYNTELNLAKTSLQFENDNTPVLHMDLNRGGNMSVYGNISVDHVSDKGKVVHVGTVKGVAVYTPNTVRHLSLPLDSKAGVNYHKGSLQIAFTNASGPAEKVTQERIVLN